MKTIAKIENDFRSELGSIADKFEVFELSVADARTSDAQYVWHPGVYVWWHPSKGPVKVGRHLTNSRKRALEHIGANTGGVLASLGSDSSTKLLLFNVRNPEDRHWVAAIEIYFETVLDPSVPSDRLG
ncbi:MAG: hypothetical protein ACE5D4_09020 [Thermodesulfobacteriota bacterium]